MGYTHYLKQSKPFTDENWELLVKEVKKIFANTDVPLANGCGDAGTSPVFEKGRILFNGVEDDAHETCVVNNNATEFGFCKTAYKPYDKVVVAVWKAARKYNPSITLTSDGGEEVFN